MKPIKMDAVKLCKRCQGKALNSHNKTGLCRDCSVPNKKGVKRG